MNKDNPNEKPAVEVTLQTVENKSRTVTEEVVATVSAKLRATLEAKLSGRISVIPVVLGQKVKAGEMLVRLDAAEFNARLAQAQATLDQAERDWNRAKALFEKQALTRAEFESAQSHYHLAEGVMAEANAMMGYVEVVAPFDGVITKKWVDVGDFAQPGKPLIIVEDPTVLQLEADVPQAIASFVQPHARVDVRGEGLAVELTGTISEIAPTTDPSTRTVRVKVDLPDQPGLTSGQFVRLVIPVGESSSMRVPASAVVRRGQLEFVFVVTERQARLHLVKTGKRIGEELEILSGLQEGDVVVAEDTGRLEDGRFVGGK